MNSNNGLNGSDFSCLLNGSSFIHQAGALLTGGMVLFKKYKSESGHEFIVERFYDGKSGTFSYNVFEKRAQQEV